LAQDVVFPGRRFETILVDGQTFREQVHHQGHLLFL
jgi:hypothetical protein